jgi:hypothetical protein
VGVDGAGHEGAEKLLEGGEASMRVGDHEVAVVREDAEGVDLDAIALGREREDIGEDLIDHLARAEQKLTVQAATRDEVGGTWKDLPGSRHGPKPEQGACHARLTE